MKVLHVRTGVLHAAWASDLLLDLLTVHHLDYRLQRLLQWTKNIHVMLVQHWTIQKFNWFLLCAKTVEGHLHFRPHLQFCFDFWVLILSLAWQEQLMLQRWQSLSLYDAHGPHWRLVQCSSKACVALLPWRPRIKCSPPIPGKDLAHRYYNYKICRKQHLPSVTRLG